MAYLAAPGLAAGAVGTPGVGRNPILTPRVGAGSDFGLSAGQWLLPGCLGGGRVLFEACFCSSCAFRSGALEVTYICPPCPVGCLCHLLLPLSQATCCREALSPAPCHQDQVLPLG